MLRELATNKEVLTAIQERGSSGTDQYFLFTLDNGTFHIQILGGDYGSQPNVMLENLYSYELVTIKLWDHKEPPSSGLDWEPMVIPTNALGFNIPQFTINFNVRFFPHQPIEVRHDPRFKDQPWAKDFESGTAVVSPDIICDILRYCEKISHLKAFW